MRRKTSFTFSFLKINVLFIYFARCLIDILISYGVRNPWQNDGAPMHRKWYRGKVNNHDPRCKEPGTIKPYVNFQLKLPGLWRFLAPLWEMFHLTQFKRVFVRHSLTKYTSATLMSPGLRERSCCNSILGSEEGKIYLKESRISVSRYLHLSSGRLCLQTPLDSSPQAGSRARALF